MAWHGECAAPTRPRAATAELTLVSNVTLFSFIILLQCSKPTSGDHDSRCEVPKPVTADKSCQPTQLKRAAEGPKGSTQAMPVCQGSQAAVRAQVRAVGTGHARVRTIITHTHTHDEIRLGVIGGHAVAARGARREDRHAAAGRGVLHGTRVIQVAHRHGAAATPTATRRVSGAARKRCSGGRHGDGRCCCCWRGADGRGGR